MQIAVVGIGCRYPGANSAAELFENVLAGRRYFREVPPERWKLSDYYHADRNHPDTTYCKQAAFIEGFDFNPAAFKIPQSTYKATDLAQWLALTVAKEALEDAELGSLPLDQTAVILGNTLAGETSRANLVRFRWPYARRVFDELLAELKLAPEARAALLERIEERYKSAFPPVNEDNLAGGLANTIAGRVCNYFNFKGGGYTVDGACSSSLLSIQEACVGLEQRLCDLALAGGVDISLDPFEMVGFAKVGALSDSDIRVYDKRANGFLPGEGCGLVVLKRLDDALHDRNRVYAVIRGVGYSSDGRGGITAPSVAGQSLAVDRAYHVAGYPFSEVDLVEGHGTGTPVGDRTELTTFIEAKKRHGAPDEHRCGVGSIKSIIGHTKAAAGVAGFIKAAMAVYHEVLPPTMGVTLPHELFRSSPHLYPLIEGRRWQGRSPFRAAVSSAGFGGINTHITLEHRDSEAGRTQRLADPAYLMRSYQASEAFLIGANDESAMLEKLAQLADVARRLCHAELVDLAVYCAGESATKRVRLGVVADTPAALHRKLEHARAELAARLPRGADAAVVDHREGIYLMNSRRTPRIAFLFPGQGSQYVGMGRRWHERYALVARHWSECDGALVGELPSRLSDYVWRDAYWAHPERWDEWSAALKDTSVAQPAIVAASMASAELLRYLGVEADVHIGHSLGEYTALWAAGAFDKLAALRLVCRRGAAMAESSAAPGAMLSIAATPPAVEALLAEVKGYAVISNYNAPKQTVVSGDRETIRALAVACKRVAVACTELPVATAFHSRLMKPAQQLMAPALAAASVGRLRRCVISSVDGTFIEPDGDLRELLTKQITAPVRYVRAVETAVAEGIDLFIEVGPGTVLAGLTSRIVGAERAVFATDGAAQDDASQWNGLIAYLHACGLPLVVGRLFENRFYRPFRLPYAPKFITSPCEEPVPSLRLETQITLSAGAVTGVPLPAASAAAVPAAATSDSAPGPWTRERVFAYLQDLISNRFGYPRDMVRDDVRLSDDLNLDSIKSVEVLAETLGRVGLTADLGSLVRLTLGEMAERIQALAAGGGAAVPSGATAPAVIPDDLPSWVRQFQLRSSEQALSQVEITWPRGSVLVAAAQPSPLVRALGEALAAGGLVADAHTGDEPVAAGAARYVGCIVIAPAEWPGELTEIGAADLESRLLKFPQWLLATTQAFLRSCASDERGFFALVTSDAGPLASSPARPHAHELHAGAGFVRSLFLEQPRLQARVVELAGALSPEAAAACVVSELHHGKGCVEAAYTASGRRFAPRAAPVSLPAMPTVQPSWTAADVVLITGGAKGITAECALELFKGRPARLALVGSSPPPDAKAPAGQEIAAALERFRQAGVSASYYQCDIARAENVAALVKRVESEMGAVTDLVHAAGVNVPHRIEDLTAEDLRRVLAPKMLGLAHLLRALPLARCRSITALSSVIAKSGMAGNSDYAYANEWVNAVLRRMQVVHPHLRCRSFNFSVWDEVGMGVRLNSVEGLRRLGIDAIPVAEGARRFAALMQREWPATDLVVTARLGSLGTIDFGASEPARARFLERILRHQPGVELVAEVSLHPASDRYVAEHNYGGSLLFPAVMGMEAMAQVAAACLQVDGEAIGRPRLENLKFLRPVVVPAEGRAIRIYAQADEAEADGTRRVRVRIRSSVNQYDADCFLGECVWTTKAEKLQPARAQWPAALALDPQDGLYGTIFFQGPVFQNITAFHDVSATHCLADVRVPAEHALHAGSYEGRFALDSPFVRDAFLHAVQVCVPQYRILPIGIDAVDIRGLRPGRVFLQARERQRADKEFVYDLDVYNPAGRCVERIRGYRCRVIDDYADADALARVRALHEMAAQRRTAGAALPAALPVPEDGIDARV